jgi:ubiquitin fusion degradation protein 1
MLSGSKTSDPSSATLKGKDKAPASDEAKWSSGGQKLGGPVTYGAGGARAPQITQRKAKTEVPKRERSPTPDFGVDDDEIIDIDSD